MRHGEIDLETAEALQLLSTRIAAGNVASSKLDGP